MSNRRPRPPIQKTDVINLWVITSDKIDHKHAEQILRNYLHTQFTPMQLAFGKVNLCMHSAPHPFKEHLKKNFKITEQLINHNIKVLLIWDGICPRTKDVLRILRKSGDHHITQFASKPRKFKPKNSS